jgi:hypothetical protein
MTASSSVSFAPLVTAYAYPHIDDYSDEEVEACWYTRKEMQSTKADAKTTLMVMGVNRVNHDSMCTRGLEYITPEARVQRYFIRANAKNAVFKEQNSQLADKMCNRDKIAEVYYMKTHRSQMVARLMARVDRKVVVQMN